MLYFAYGSNLLEGRMKSRCPSAYCLGVATLSGYELVFQANNTGRFVANIIPNEDSIVSGVLYEIDTKDAAVLDSYEGHPFVYKRTLVPVSIDGEEAKVFTYIMGKKSVGYDFLRAGAYLQRVPVIGNKGRAFGCPHDFYLDYIYDGFVEHGMDVEELFWALKRTEQFERSAKRKDKRK